MASLKLLGQKRKKENDLNLESKEESTLSSNQECSQDIKYINFDPNKIAEALVYYWSSDKKPISSPKIKLNDEKFKIKRNYNLNSRKTETIGPFRNKSNNFNELLRNEKEYLYHFLKMKNYSIKEINLLKNNPPKKFHMILDIDSTMIKAVEKADKPSNPKPDDFEISGSIDDRTSFEFYCRYRPYLFHFIHELKDYFHFYISTLGHVNYANKIIEDLVKKAEISIPDINIVSNRIPGQKLVKSLSEIKSISNFQEELNGTVIIDDVINYWIKPPNIIKPEDEIKQCIKCLIPSKRYVINSAKGPDAEKFGILLHNNIFEQSYNKALNYSTSVDYFLCIEKDSDSEKGKKGQFFYLEIFMKKCIKFCLYTGKPLVEVMDFFRKKIFEKCKFNLRFLDNEWNYIISNLISELGGDIVINLDETTHFIVKDEINKDKIIWLKKNQNVININYIFQCYFNLYRMDESENQAFSKGKK